MTCPQTSHTTAHTCATLRIRRTCAGRTPRMLPEPSTDEAPRRRLSLSSTSRGGRLLFPTDTPSRTPKRHGVRGRDGVTFRPTNCRHGLYSYFWSARTSTLSLTRTGSLSVTRRAPDVLTPGGGVGSCRTEGLWFLFMNNPQTIQSGVATTCVPSMCSRCYLLFLSSKDGCSSNVRSTHTCTQTRTHTCVATKEMSLRSL